MTEKISSKDNGLQEKAVASFLEDHNDFFLSHEGLLESISIPSINDEKVSSLSDFQIKKLKRKVALLEERNKLLIQTSVQNLESQNMIYILVSKLLNATTIVGLKGTLSKELKNNLDLDSVRLLRLDEKTDGISRKEIKDLLGVSKFAKLRTISTEKSQSIHGKTGQSILSDALIPLQSSSGKFLGVLVLGSKNRQRFHEGQGSELLDFLGGVLAHCVERCSENPSQSSKSTKRS